MRIFAQSVILGTIGTFDFFLLAQQEPTGGGAGAIPTVGTLSATAILGWVVWYLLTKRIPDDQKNAEAREIAALKDAKEREQALLTIVGVERQEHRRELKACSDEYMRSIDAMRKSFEEMIRQMRSDFEEAACRIEEAYDKAMERP